jgi:hypothetical protein
MPLEIRLSHQSLRVLKVFLEQFSEDVRSVLAGTDLMKATRLPSGTLYPILLRFEKAGVLTSRWEDESPESLGRPRRRFYRITAEGVALAHDALKDLGSPLANPRLHEA